MASALSFLECYQDGGRNGFPLIITGDETWIQCDTPETKQQSNNGRTHIHQTNRKSLKNLYRAHRPWSFGHIS